MDTTRRTKTLDSAWATKSKRQTNVISKTRELFLLTNYSPLFLLHAFKMNAPSFTLTKMLPSSYFHHHNLPFSTQKPLPSKPSISSHNILCIPRRAYTYSFNNLSYGFKRSVVKSQLNEKVNKVEDLEQKQNQKQPLMNRAYPFHEIEPKWQRYWEDNHTFRTPDEVDTSKPKFYVLDMFPYPR